MEDVPAKFEAPFGIVAETASDAIITIDERSTIVFVNPAVERIFGHSIRDMVGQPMTMLMPEYLRHIHEHGLRRYVETGQRHIPWEGIELPGLHKDGRTVQLEVSFGEFVVNGQHLFTGIARDVTQRNHQQRLKAAYTAAIRILAEHPSSDSVLAETLSAICSALAWKLGILWNAQGTSDELSLAANWCVRDELSEFVRQSESIRFKKGVGLPGRVWATKQPAWVLRISEDSNFPRSPWATQLGLLSGAAFPIIADNEVIAVMEFFNTEIQPPDQELLDTFKTIGHQMGQYIERRHAEEALERSENELRRLVASEMEARRQAETANRMKDEFLAILSHELRTPLTSVFGWVQLLQGRGVDPATSAKALEVIDRNIRIQAQLIDDLLDLSQIITGKMQIHRQMIELLQIVRTTIETARPSADAKNIALQLSAEPDIPPISADPARLQQVVWNLLSNAVKFTPKGGTIAVNVTRNNSNLQVRVSDTGDGISRDFLPRVFDRFSQADSTATRPHRGLGLGLAIVRHLVELHGGTVKADSDGISKGSTFTISLPLTEGVPQSLESKMSIDPSPVPPSLQDVKILLVEDETDTREMIAGALQQSGASVFQTSSAVEALSALDRETPDIIITDIAMPQVDGYQLLAKIQARDTKIPPTVALTAYVNPADKERALRAGFQAHIGKPVEIAELISVIAGLVERKG